MENKVYHLRYLPVFEQDLISTVSYITNVLKNEDAALHLVDDVEAAILERLNNPLAFEPYEIQISIYNEKQRLSGQGKPFRKSCVPMSLARLDNLFVCPCLNFKNNIIETLHLNTRVFSGVIILPCRRQKRAGGTHMEITIQNALSLTQSMFRLPV